MKWRRSRSTRSGVGWMRMLGGTQFREGRRSKREVVWPRGAVVGGRGAGWWGRRFMGQRRAWGARPGTQSRQANPPDPNPNKIAYGPPNACASAAPPIQDRERRQHMIAHEIAAISLDAQRRRLHALVRRYAVFCTGCRN